jgi:hypothetical protein
MKYDVNMAAQVKVEAPPEVGKGEVAEALLQEFAAFLANRPGLRAQNVSVGSGPEIRGYALRSGLEAVTAAVSPLEAVK